MKDEIRLPDDWRSLPLGEDDYVPLRERIVRGLGVSPRICDYFEELTFLALSHRKNKSLIVAWGSEFSDESLSIVSDINHIVCESWKTESIVMPNDSFWLLSMSLSDDLIAMKIKEKIRKKTGVDIDEYIALKDRTLRDVVNYIYEAKKRANKVGGKKGSFRY